MGPAVEKLRDELPEMISLQREVLSRPEPPEIPAGPQCENPVRCEFYDHCNPELPTTTSRCCLASVHPGLGSLLKEHHLNL